MTAEKPKLDVATFMKFLIFVIVSMFWAVLGFIVWIPIVFRNIIIASFVSVSRILKGQDIEYTIKSISDSVLLYFDGFRIIFGSIFGPSGSQSGNVSRTLTARSLPIELILGSVILYIFYVIMFSKLSFVEHARQLFQSSVSIFIYVAQSVKYIFGH